MIISRIKNSNYIRIGEVKSDLPIDTLQYEVEVKEDTLLKMYIEYLQDRKQNESYYLLQDLEIADLELMLSKQSSLEYFNGLRNSIEATERIKNNILFTLSFYEENGLERNYEALESSFKKSGVYRYPNSIEVEMFNIKID